MSFIGEGVTSSKYQDWCTPKYLYDELDSEFHFDFDPCPVNPKFDGLTIEWGGVNFVNPPYKDVGVWIKKGHEEWSKGKTIVFLIFARTDTRWFHDYIYNKQGIEIRFLKGRVKFVHKEYTQLFPAPAPSMIVIMRGQK